MSEIEKKFRLPSRHRNPKDVWLEFEDLITQYRPLDLAQGFPDFPPSHSLTSILRDVASCNDILLHQYTRDYGHPRLVEVLSKLYSPPLKRKLDAQNEILVSVGAYEALLSAILGHVDVDDEVIIIEPFFDCYQAMVNTAGGVPRFIPLRLKQRTNEVLTSADFALDVEELVNLFNSKTKVIILNNPNNSFGKVYKREELHTIAELCVKWNVLCISDEVFEWTVPKSKEHIKIATLPGMWERTITIGSAGKTFSVTGWRVGWAYGPANLLHNLKMVHQNSVYTGVTPLQEVVAVGLENELSKIDREDCYFNVLPTELESKRNILINALDNFGVTPVVPEAGYFMTANWVALESKVDLDSEDDGCKNYRFTKWMIKNVGVRGIPLTAFYGDHKNLGEHFVRFCFFKKNESLQEADRLFRKWKFENCAAK